LWYFLFERKEIESFVALSSVAMLLTTALQSPITLEPMNSAISANVYSFFRDTTQIEC